MTQNNINTENLKRYETVREIVEERYKNTIDRIGIKFFHHFTSLEKILDKIYQNHTSKGQEITCINFDYIDVYKMKTYALLHSAIKDEIFNEEEFDSLFSWDEKDFMLRYSKVLRIGDDCSMFEVDEISHYMRLIFLADVRFHTDILTFDEFELKDYHTLRFYFKLYKKIINFNNQKEINI